MPQLPTPRPEKRRLRIYAFDPLASHAPNSMLGSAAENEVVLEIEYEKLERGPFGRRVAVIDYDGTSGHQYAPVDLDDPWLLAQDGLAPAEGDPRFHQQMTYAVAMRTIENFDRALGRRIRFTNRQGGPFKGLGDRLGIVPHAFRDENAYFEPVANAVMFGYFNAEARPGSPFVPDQTVFTCLSSDVITHEVTHGLIHRLRPNFMEGTNADVGAFHEGFADIVAILQHFTYPDLLRRVIERTGGALDQPGVFVDLAQQFGRAGGGDAALRTAIDDAKPEMYSTVFEEHDRGAILVAAVFEAFFQAYHQRVADLVPPRGFTGTLARGVVQRVARDAEETAQQFLTMCIRAFEYLPPADVRFGDFLRAALTADYEVNGNATRRNRELLIDGFRRRGIVPDGVFSLSEASLRWFCVEPDELPPIPNKLVVDSVMNAHLITRGRDIAPGHRQFAAALRGYGRANADALGLRSDLPVAPKSFHTSFHIGEDGQLRAEIVAVLEQCDPAIEIGGLPMRGGTTVVAAADGAIRYAIIKPLPGVVRRDLERTAQARLERTREYLEYRDETDSSLAWFSETEANERVRGRLALSRIHSMRGGW